MERFPHDDGRQDEPKGILSAHYKDFRMSEEAEKRVKGAILRRFEAGVPSRGLVNTGIRLAGATAAGVVCLAALVYYFAGMVPTGRQGGGAKTADAPGTQTDRAGTTAVAATAVASALIGPQVSVFDKTGKPLAHGETANVPMKLAEGTTIVTENADPVGLDLGAHRLEMHPESSLTLSSLEAKALSLRLNSGNLSARVHKLGHGERFSVAAGTVLVEVVGTIFSVGFTDSGVAVEVQEGEVRIVHGSQKDRLAAGGRRVFPGIRVADSGADLRSKAAMPGRQAERRSAESLTEEEKVFSRAQKALIQEVNPGKAIPHFRQYLDRYPSGMFVPEALIHLGEACEKLGDFSCAQNHYRKFMQSYPDDSRSVRVGVLLAASLIRHGTDLTEVPGVLRKALDLPPEDRTREHALYLTVTFESKTGSRDRAEKHAKEYVRLYPAGRFAEDVCGAFPGLCPKK